MMDGEEKETGVCVVCEEEKELFALADCRHRFCRECCVGYIKSQADNFSQARCLQEGCRAVLSKNKPIYRVLNQDIIARIDNYDRFQFLQNNPSAAACRKQDCPGHFIKTAISCRCEVCNTAHCVKCLDILHEGPCNADSMDIVMRGLRYRKCPKCSIWVEKVDGCEFINCKCGIEFCYRCGEEYAKDPCRKREVWRKEAEIRRLMSGLKITIPSDLPAIFLLLLRAMAFLAILVPFTVLFCVVPAAVLLAVVQVLVCLLMPLVVFWGVSQSKDCECKWLGYLLAVLFYPLLGAFFALVALIIIFLYPFARNKYHHGVYDPFDLLLSNMTLVYLRFVRCVLLCCR